MMAPMNVMLINGIAPPAPALRPIMLVFDCSSTNAAIVTVVTANVSVIVGLGVISMTPVRAMDMAIIERMPEETNKSGSCMPLSPMKNTTETRYKSISLGGRENNHWRLLIVGVIFNTFDKDKVRLNPEMKRNCAEIMGSICMKNNKH